MKRAIFKAALAAVALAAVGATSMASAQDKGTLDERGPTKELSIGIGGMSVSGYILAAPGLGRL